MSGREWFRRGAGIAGMEAWGLTWRNGRWLFGTPAWLSWLPYGLSERFQSAWNHVACRVLGHEYMPDFCAQDMRGVMESLRPGQREVAYQGCGREVCTYCADERQQAQDEEALA